MSTQFNTTDPTKPGWQPAKDMNYAPLRELAIQLAQDARTIAARLQIEAERRSWCDEYKTFTEAVNSFTSHRWLGPQPRPYKATITIEIEAETNPDSSHDTITRAAREAITRAAKERAEQFTDVHNVQVNVR